MPIRLVVPFPGPWAFMRKSRGDRLADQLLKPPAPSPERLAESKHEARHATRWVVYGIVAVCSLYFVGAGALWFLVPAAALLLAVQAAGNHIEATATPAELAYRRATREINARLPKMGPDGCTQCGSTAMHRDAAGKTVWPHTFHAAEVGQAISARAAEILAANP